MLVVDTLLLTLPFIFESIESSLQFDCLPNGEPIFGTPRRRPSYSPEYPVPPAEPYHRARSRTPTLVDHPPGRILASTQSHLCLSSHSPFARSNSPSAGARDLPMRLPSLDVHRGGNEQLESIRLVSNEKPHRIYELRRFTFPDDKFLKISIGKHMYGPVPAREQVVLSTSNGDVLAILRNHNTFVGIYRKSGGLMKRSKINIGSCVITPLNPEEIKEAPVSPNRHIETGYIIKYRNIH